MTIAMRLNASPTYALIYSVLGSSVAVATYLLRTWQHGSEVPPNTSCMDSSVK
jgi:hypothetical protein